MSGKVMILGGYGNFGKRIAAALVRRGIPVIIAGRDRDKAETLVGALGQASAEAAVFDATRALGAWLERSRPAVLINTIGPFQTGTYDTARLCVAQGVHYIDLADGRDFVTGIGVLDRDAAERGVVVISGASTVPGLSSAVVEHYRAEFSAIDSLIFGISPGQGAERGLATTKGILTYVGKPLRPFAGAARPVYGWQDLYRQDYPVLGRRWMANCEIPDLDLLPPRYGITAIRFSAGMELGFMHLGLWLLSWGVRLGLPLRMADHAERLLALSNWFNRFGSADGGMHVILRGRDQAGRSFERRWFIVAEDGDGPQIPCVPAILLAERLAGGERMRAGAYPCVGLVSLGDYLAALAAFRIRTFETG